MTRYVMCALPAQLVFHFLWNLRCWYRMVWYGMVWYSIELLAFVCFRILITRSCFVLFRSISFREWHRSCSKYQYCTVQRFNTAQSFAGPAWTDGRGRRLLRNPKPPRNAAAAATISQRTTFFFSVARHWNRRRRRPRPLR